MSRIRGKDTKPEMIVRRVLWAAGLRYRLHDKRLPGKPDLAFPGRRMAVFVHGCFWHCHEGCKDFRIPKTRTSWWVEKLSRNKTRDTRVAAELKNRGWQVIVIWECEVHDPQKLASLVAQIRQAAETTAP
ncbi:DNA mismatch endonuclease Vsr [Ralstonia pseudosolanacearum]|uniref:Very short patch repair endonuclease n=2 Tax=Ralstonia pseudosolanacearum TaxID=1310165 RepID=A0A454TXL6_9RALS|nr:DNA mismatch endonuclease Vsr [Ralstonia pseudosolanacearum]RAA16438.1 DNA mismatch endonuclease Vsr [Ralstonia pseudosolanacearum]RNM10465.1 DNA mismatch endonuclease Vsr [Ralstonia pseudosolanacearum]